MKFNTYSRILLPLSTVALLTMTLNAYATETPTVVDAVSGQSMPVSEIDMPNLTDEQRQDVRDQMTELGIEQQSRNAYGMPEQSRNAYGMPEGQSGMAGMGNASDSDGGNGGAGNGGGNGGAGNGGGGNGAGHG